MDLKAIMLYDIHICGVPKGFRNHAEADDLECLYDPNVWWFGGTSEDD